jgi:hypothetical protein
MKFPVSRLLTQERMAGTTGFEPATSVVTGDYSAIGWRRITRLRMRFAAIVGMVRHSRSSLVKRLGNGFKVTRLLI